MVIDSALEKISENNAKELKTHIVYAGTYFYGEDKLRPLILQAIKQYKLKSVMVTNIVMRRSRLITKEKMDSYYKGKQPETDSVDDDIESFFEDLRLGKEPNDEAMTYFLPKLTENELELVERTDPCYLGTFMVSGRMVDVEKAEMKLSKSDSKFVKGFVLRETFTVEASSLYNTFHCKH